MVFLGLVGFFFLKNRLVSRWRLFFFFFFPSSMIGRFGISPLPSSWIVLMAAVGAFFFPSGKMSCGRCFFSFFFFDRGGFLHLFPDRDGHGLPFRQQHVTISSFPNPAP